MQDNTSVHFDAGIPMTQGIYTATCQYCGMHISKTEMLQVLELVKHNTLMTVTEWRKQWDEFQDAVQRVQRWRWTQEFINPFGKPRAETD